MYISDFAFIIFLPDTCTLRKKCPYSEIFWSVYFPHLDCIRRFKEYISVFHANSEKNILEKLRIRTILTQW